MIGLRQVRETAADVSEKLAATAADTKSAMGALAVLGVAALAVAVLALVVASKARRS